MAKSPFKMKGFSGFGNSPLRHPHDTWKQATSHDKDQPHPKSTITKETVVDDLGVEVDVPKTKEKLKKEKPLEGLRKGLGKEGKPIRRRGVEIPLSTIRPPSYGLDR